MYQLIIVDDEKGSQDILAHYINSDNELSTEFKILGCFFDGKAAFDFSSSNKVDLIITDIKMPTMNGLQLSKKVKESNLGCNILIVSGYGEFEYAKEAIKYDVFNYILKPVDFSELKSTLLTLKKTLDTNRKSEDSRALAHEEFIANLFAGNIKDAAGIENQFTQLKFPFAIDDFKGCTIILNIPNLEAYIQNSQDNEFEKMEKAVLNIIKLTLSGVYIYPVNYQENSIILALICDFDDSLLFKIDFALKSVAPFQFKLDLIFTFNSIKEIKPIQEIGALNIPSNKSELIVDIENFLIKNANRNIYRADVGRVFNMNESYLGRLFKKSTGLSIYEYHLKERMRKAIEMIAMGEKIVYIAKRLGFTEQRTFSRSFKTFIGYSPEEYRNKILQVEEDDEDV